MKKLLWPLWIVITLAIGGYYGYALLTDDQKDVFLVGDASHGHFQIELACNACHTEAFGGEEILQDACENCHAQELKDAHDSHPKKKFTDPRNADRLEVLDARYCVSCHVEHQAEQTHPMGVTLPEDYCYHCHVEVGEERESHKDLPFDSCASAGCHNYHDNRALYEDFLVDNSEGPWLKAMAKIAEPNAASKMKIPSNRIELPVFEDKKNQHPDIAGEWSASSHAAAGVGCAGCHTNPGETASWIEKPGIEQCQSCHTAESEGYLMGKHGMRLAQNMAGASPGQSNMEFKSDSADKVHGCNSCHVSHEFNTEVAATEACLTCHNDEHSLAFESSPHGKLAKKAANGEIDADSTVTCATCHMPRVVHGHGDKATVSVQHNQNDNLRPNEKMIRPVCMQCHNLEFSIDALADENLIRNNFTGQPATHIPSIDWALKRTKE